LVLSCFGAAQSDRDLICVDHAAYIASRIKVLNGKRAIFSTASHAQRAAGFLYGLQKSASPQADAA
jgi:antirestriction protein ArdC